MTAINCLITLVTKSPEGWFHNWKKTHLLVNHGMILPTAIPRKKTKQTISAGEITIFIHFPTFFNGQPVKPPGKSPHFPMVNGALELLELEVFSASAKPADSFDPPGVFLLGSARFGCFYLVYLVYLVHLAMQSGWWFQMFQSTPLQNLTNRQLG